MNPESEPSQQFLEAEQPQVDQEEQGESQTEIKRGMKESAVSYLHRGAEMITQKMKEKDSFFDPTRAKEQDLPEDIREMIHQLMENALTKQDEQVDPEANKKFLEDIDSEVGFHDRGHEVTDSASFDETERNRQFFEGRPGKGLSKRETYWNTLFFPI
ncbi:MAG: hypothetical protein V1848_01360 [Candidatus Magasanikbacteria bacterium]